MVRYGFDFIIIGFFFREGERESRSNGGGAEGVGERENLNQASCPVQSPTWGSVLRSQDHDPSRNQESVAQLTEPPSCHFSFNFLFPLDFCLFVYYFFPVFLDKGISFG